MTRVPYIVFNTLLLLTLLEGGARLAEQFHPPLEDLKFDYAPYRMLRMTQAPWGLNRDGFRAPELSSLRSAEQKLFLIEFLGGSVCLGVGTEPGKTVPERLEAALQEAGLRHAKVINLCQGGASTAQELAIFLQFGLPLRPQVVLSFNGANDLMHPRPLGDDPSPNLPYHDREMRALFEGQHGLAAHLALTRVAVRLAKRMPPAPHARLAESNAVPAADIVDSYLYTTDIVRVLTEAQQGHYAVLLQPTLHYRKPWSQAESRMWRERRPGDSVTASQHAAALYDSARASLSLWSNRTGTPVFDLTGTFEDTSGTVYSDSVHFTGETGYRLIQQELQRQGLVRMIAERYQEWENSKTAPEHVRPVTAERSNAAQGGAWLH